MVEIKGLGLRWLCPACGRVIDKPPTAVKDPSTRKVRRYHSSHCQTPLVRCTVELGEKVDAEVIRLRDAVRALTEDEWGPLSDDVERCALCRRKWSKHGDDDADHPAVSSALVAYVIDLRAALDGEA